MGPGPRSSIDFKESAQILIFANSSSVLYMYINPITKEGDIKSRIFVLWSLWKKCLSANFVSWLTFTIYVSGWFWWTKFGVTAFGFGPKRILVHFLNSEDWPKSSSTKICYKIKKSCICSFPRESTKNEPYWSIFVEDRAKIVVFAFFGQIFKEFSMLFLIAYINPLFCIVIFFLKFHWNNSFMMLHANSHEISIIFEHMRT